MLEGVILTFQRVLALRIVISMLVLVKMTHYPPNVFEFEVLTGVVHQPVRDGDRQSDEGARS